LPSKARPLEIYALLPKTDCGKCGESNCMAFAIKLLEKTIALSACIELEEPKYKEQKQKLTELIAPPIKAVVIGSGEKAVRIGGEEVMYRHELTYYNPVAVAIDVDDEMSEDESLRRARAVEEFQVNRVGQSLRLNLIAVRNVSGEANKFAKAVSFLVKNFKMPLILCSFDANVLEAGLAAAKGIRPLIYAATKDNWQHVGELALMYDCPLAVFAPRDLNLLRSISSSLMDMGVADIVLDPGTFPDEGLSDTINNFTMLRRAGVEQGDKKLGFPLIGVPAVVWVKDGVKPELNEMKESYLASMLLARYASILIMHSIDSWALLPVLTLRQNIYTDPRKPVAVESGLKKFGEPNEESPVLVTSNFALTYYTVASDIESAKINCHLLVLDTEGLSVQTSVAGKKFTASKLAGLIKSTGIEGRVKHRKIVIPGYAARLKGDIEDSTGWEVMVGPIDSSGIPKFLEENWRKKA